MKKDRFTTALLIVVFLAGLSLLLYPTVANYINELHGSRAITTYAEEIAAISPEEYDAYMAAARAYNDGITKKDNPYIVSDLEKAQYNDLLNVGGNGVMGYIEIPAIAVSLPIYHGTSDRVLQVAVGHLDWTSLPVGGASTHCALSGHRGLPSAKLFTNLDKLVEGDVFMIRILDEILTYQVDQILIVLPTNTQDLQVEKGKDYCTLVTCTPYGINTHRLLVRGHRIENAKEAISITVTAEAIQVEPLIVASVLGVPSLVLMMLIVSVFGGKRKEDSDMGGNDK